MNEELLSFKENLLVEELERLYNSSSLTKSAGLFESLGGLGAGEWLGNFAKDYLKDSSEVPGGYVTSLVNLLAPAVIFRINPFLGLFYVGLSSIGFDISGIAVRVAKLLKPKLDNSEPVSRSEVAQAVNEAAGSMSAIAFYQDQLQVYSDYNCINDFKYLIQETKKELTKEAWGRNYYSSYGKETPFLFGGGKNVSIFRRIFGRMLESKSGKSKLFGIAKGLVFWIITTVLASTLLLAGGRALLGKPKIQSLKDKDLPSSDKKESVDAEEKTREESKDSTSDKEPQTQHQILWLETIESSLPPRDAIENMLINWTLYFYPNLSQYPDIEDVILESNKFKEVVSKITKDPNKIGQIRVQMPQEYVTSRDTMYLKKTVVDKFINEINQNLKNIEEI